MSRASARTAVVAAALMALLLLAHAAWGATTAKAPRTMTTSSGSWGVAGANNSTTPVAGTQLSASWVVLTNTGPKFGTVKNLGSLVLVTAAYTVTASGLAVAGDVTLEACFGATWNTSGSGSCAGTIVLLDAATSAGATTAIAPTQPNGTLSVRLRATGLTILTSATVSISVARTNVRAATITYS